MSERGPEGWIAGDISAHWHARQRVWETGDTVECSGDEKPKADFWVIVERTAVRRRSG